MALIENMYEITVTVRHMGKTYIRHRSDVKRGCNHIDNIAGTADYMGQEIRKEIKEKVGK